MEVEAPTYDGLHDFSCGDDDVWETDLNETVQMLARVDGPVERRVLVVEDESSDAYGAFIGVASVLPYAPGETLRELPAMDDAIYIQALGITDTYRKAELPDDSPIGGWLLDRVLHEIRLTWTDKARPVWAIVHKQNERCRRMLRPREFELYPVAGDYDVWVRSREAASD